jgi:hypothetical protein
LKEAGYIEGITWRIEYRWAENQMTGCLRFEKAGPGRVGYEGDGWIKPALIRSTSAIAQRSPVSSQRLHVKTQRLRIYRLELNVERVIDALIESAHPANGAITITTYWPTASWSAGS